MEKRKELFCAVLGFLGAMLGCLAVNLLNRYVIMPLPRPARAVCLPVIYWLIAAVPIILMCRRRETLADIGFSAENLPAQLLTGLALGLAMSLVLTLLPHLAGLGEWVDSGTNYTKAWQFVYEFVYCIIAVGAVEEFVFRGYLYAKLESVCGKEWGAAVLSSVLFGLMHIFTGSILQVCMTMFLGFALCVMRMKMRRCTLLSLVIAHGVYDAMISVWAAVFAGR